MKFFGALPLVRQGRSKKRPRELAGKVTPDAEGHFWPENVSVTSRVKGGEKKTVAAQNMFHLSQRQSSAKVAAEHHSARLLPPSGTLPVCRPALEARDNVQETVEDLLVALFLTCVR